jgi:hypothetical protein
MQQAEDNMQELIRKGYDRTDASDAAKNKVVGAIGLSNLQSGLFKQQQQAEDNFLNAVLRRESGASISPDERSSGERQYFARPGDDSATLQQKAENRALAIAGLRSEAGKAWDRLQPQSVASQSPNKPKQPPNGVIPSATAEIGGSAAVPPVGTVMDGYKFKGGDPNNKANWVKL